MPATAPIADISQVSLLDLECKKKDHLAAVFSKIRLAQRGTLEDEGPHEDQKHNCRRAEQE